MVLQFGWIIHGQNSEKHNTETAAVSSDKPHRIGRNKILGLCGMPYRRRNVGDHQECLGERSREVVDGLPVWIGRSVGDCARYDDD